MKHSASKSRNSNQTRCQNCKSLIPRCKLILLRWFSPLQRLISSDKDEPLGDDKRWQRFSVSEMVDDLFSENSTTRAWALRKTRQLMMDFPNRLVFNVIGIKMPSNLYPLYPESLYEEIIPALKYLMKQTDSEVLNGVTWAVELFACQGNWHRRLLIDAGIHHTLIPLLSHSDSEVAASAFKGVDLFIGGTDEQRQAVWDCGFLNHFHNMLGNKYICGWVLPCLSALAAGNRELLCALFELGLLSQVEDHGVHNGMPAMTAGDLMKYNSCKQVPSVINWCFFNQLCELLSGIQFDTSLTLHSLSKLLSNAGGQLEEVKKQMEAEYLVDYPIGYTAERIEELHWSVNDDESRLSYHIMEDYFG